MLYPMTVSNGYSSAEKDSQFPIKFLYRLAGYVLPVPIEKKQKIVMFIIG